MSKKKVHKKKHWSGVTTDQHHIFYTKLSWDQPLAHKLRTHWYCLVEIPKGTLHHAIHDKVRYVPVPRNEAIRAILDQLDLLEDYGAIRPDDPIEKRLAVLADICECIAQPTADALRKQFDVVSGFNKPSE